MEPPLSSGSWIGILGGGQLGRMSAQAAQRLGYKVRTYDPTPGACAAAVADEHITAAWDDTAALQRFMVGLGRVTLEFENIPPTTVARLAQTIPAHPSATVLKICQNRRHEKDFLKKVGLPCAPFEVVESLAAFKRAVQNIGFPCVLKTAAFGYDGKGQIKIPSASTDLEKVWQDLGVEAAVVESWLSFDREISVLVARTAEGKMMTFEPAENIHRNHILHLSVSPATLSPALMTQAQTLAQTVAEKLDYVGLLGVEMFVCGSQLIINELAPRPHNSGHQTLDAHVTSQFEQHIRAVCGLELASTKLKQPAAMVNLLGDLWKNGQEPNWALVERVPGAHLHLYGKDKPAPGRKMGHITVVASTREVARQQAESLHAALSA